MITLPTVALTDNPQNIYLAIDVEVYDRLILTNQSPNVLDILSGISKIRLQPYSADIFTIESPLLAVQPFVVSNIQPGSVPLAQLQLQAVRKDEELRESYPLSIQLAISSAGNWVGSLITLPAAQGAFPLIQAANPARRGFMTTRDVGVPGTVGVTLGNPAARVTSLTAGNTWLMPQPIWTGDIFVFTDQINSGNIAMLELV